MGRKVRFCGANLAEEKAEAADCEADSHEAESGADPGEEGSLGGEVDAGVLLSGLGWIGHGGIVRRFAVAGELVVGCGLSTVLTGRR